MPKISQKKLDSLKSRARNTGRKFATNVKSSATEALAGVAGFFVHSLAAEHVEFVGKRWWAGPVGMAVGGHVLKKRAKMAGAGTAMLGAAGYAGALGWKMNRASQNVPGTAPADTGALYGYDYDAGALVDPRAGAPALPSADATNRTTATSSSRSRVADAMGL